MWLGRGLLFVVVEHRAMMFRVTASLSATRAWRSPEERRSGTGASRAASARHRVSAEPAPFDDSGRGLEPPSFVPGMCPGLYSAPPGKHTVEVVSERLGDMTPTAPVSIEIESVCPADVAFGEREADSDSSPPDAMHETSEADATNAEDAPASDDATAPGASDDEPATSREGAPGAPASDASIAQASAGCSLRRVDTRSQGTIGVGLLAALAALLARRSRR